MHEGCAEAAVTAAGGGWRSGPAAVYPRPRKARGLGVGVPRDGMARYARVAGNERVENLLPPNESCVSRRNLFTEG